MDRRFRNNRSGCIGIAVALFLLSGMASASNGDAAARAAMGPRPVPTLVGPTLVQHEVIVAYGETKASHIAAYDITSGRLRWERSYGQISFSSSPAVSKGRLFTDTWSDGIYVLRAQDGNLVARLKTHACVIGAAGDLVLLTAWSEPDNGAVFFSLDARTFRRVWQVGFRDCALWEAKVEGDVVKAMLYQGLLELRGPRFQLATLRARDGRVLGRTGLTREDVPARGDVEPSIPKTLPPAARARLTQILGRADGVFLPRTRILRSGDLVFLGNLDDSTAPGTVYAVALDTGRVAWRHAAAGLSAIALGRGALFVTYGQSDERGTRLVKSLMALDRSTGRRLWGVRLLRARDVYTRGQG